MPDTATATKTTATSSRASAKRAAEARDPRIEKLLKENGFTAAELRLDVHLSEIDRAGSRRNQARTGESIDEPTVKRYITAIENGDEFPPLIMWERPGAKKLLIVDGNHRDEAYLRTGVDVVNTYIIKDAKPQAVILFSMRVNAEHGLALSEQDRLHHALYAIENGASAEEAARMFTLSATLVRTKSRQARVDARAERLGVNMRRWETVSVTARTRLDSIPLDDTFIKMAKLVTDAGLKNDAITQAVTDLAHIGSMKNQEAYIDALRETYAEQIQTGGDLDDAPVGRQWRSPRTVARRVMGQIPLLPDPAAVVGHMTDDEKAEMLPRAEDGRDKFQAYVDALKA